MACLETTFLIDLLRGKQNVIKLKDELSMLEQSLIIASPSVMELWVGACLKESENEKRQILELLNSVEVVDFDTESAKDAGEIEAELVRKGITIEAEDLMIAAIARRRSEKLVTRDQHFASVPGLRVLKY